MKQTINHHAYDGRARKRQAGLSLIEATAFLALASLVIAGALMMYNSARIEQQTTQTVSEFEAFKVGVKSLHGNQTYDTTASMNGILINSRRYPSTVVATPPGTLTNQFGGSVNVQGMNDTSVTPNVNYFYVSYTNVPREVCVGLLTNISRTGDWTHYNVGVTTSTVPTTGWTQITGQVTPVQANTACGNPRNRVTLWSR